MFGFFLILCLLFSIQDFNRTVGGPTGQPVLQILLDIFGEDGAIVLFTLIIVCVWHCGLFSVTSNSRMMFAFGGSRTGRGEYCRLMFRQREIAVFRTSSITLTTASTARYEPSGSQ